MIVGGAFSFDWGLIQPEVAKFTRVCTYDPSGTAWSDPYPSAPLCADRIDEIHQLLTNAAVPGPYVLVGFSIGGLRARLYVAKYPEEVAGMVIVDHAFVDFGSDAPTQTMVSSKSAPSTGKILETPQDVPDSPPVLISSTPITLGLEDDRNFSKLPQLDRDLHSWAISMGSIRPTAETAAECSAAVQKATEGQQFALGDKPLLVVSTNYNSPAYSKLQGELLRLSRNSKGIVAGNSSHMVIIDEPEIVVMSIHRVIDALRSGAGLR